jgi:hypothetical protein
MSVPTQAVSGSFDIAIIAATISILLGGILFGVGLGFGIRRIRLIGAEEIGQGIISAAMVGALMAFSLLLNSTTSSLVPSALPACPNIPSPESSPYSYCECHLSFLESQFSRLGAALSRSAEITGFTSSLQISAGVVSAQPFFALEEASRQLSAMSSTANLASSLAFFERSLAAFVRSFALAIFLPAGLVLRCFFATRRLGAAAMALSISAYAVYPLFFLYSFPESNAGALASDASATVESFNSQFAALPLLELDETGAVKEKIDEMSGGEFSSSLQPQLSQSGRAVSLALLDLLLFPALSLIISGVAALELYRLLSAPLFLPQFDSI